MFARDRSCNLIQETVLTRWRRIVKPFCEVQYVRINNQCMSVARHSYIYFLSFFFFFFFFFLVVVVAHLHSIIVSLGTTYTDSHFDG